MTEFEKIISDSIRKNLSSMGSLSKPQVKDMGFDDRSNIVSVKIKELDFWIRYKINRSFISVLDYESKSIASDLLETLKKSDEYAENIDDIKHDFKGVVCHVFKEGFTSNPAKYFLKVIHYNKCLEKDAVLYPDVMMKDVVCLAERIKTINKSAIQKLRKVKWDRSQALECCPVSYRCMMTDAEAWKDRLKSALEGKGRDIHAGYFKPIIHLKDGVVWVDSTLKIRADLPLSMMMGAEGKKLTDLVESELFEGLIIQKIVRRKSDDYNYIRTNASPVKLKPVLNLMGL